MGPHQLGEVENPFRAFEAAQNKKRDAVVEKYRLSSEKIVSFFEYDSLKKAEKDFCPLYAKNRKCHDMMYLNCYFCACPHYQVKDSKTLCGINSRFASFVHGVLDCSDCYIPHRKGFVKAIFKNSPPKS